MSVLIKNTKRIFVNNSGVDPTLNSRLTILENNEYKVAYFTTISSTSGTITTPTGATILIDQFKGGIDAYVSTISNGQPTGFLPQTSGGTTVDVTSFNALGNYILTGTPSSYPVALIYILKIKGVDYSNLTVDNILELEDLGSIKGNVSTTTGVIPFGTGTLNTVNTDANFKYTSNVLYSPSVNISGGTTTLASLTLQNSSALLTTPVSGAVENLSDKLYFTINTGISRKEITLNDSALTSSRIPYTTTNGRLTTNSVLQFNGTNYTATGVPGFYNIAAPSSVLTLNCTGDSTHIIFTNNASTRGGAGANATNCFHVWDSAFNNLCITVNNSTRNFNVLQKTFLGGTTVPTSFCDIGASTTSNASLRFRSGVAPTTPNDGDIWFDGTDLKMRISGVTKTFTLI